MRDDTRTARKEQIETVAYAVLAEKGFSGMSMLSVARAAKASNETLYRWYGDKLGLVTAMIARNSEEIDAALEKGTTGQGDVDATLAEVALLLRQLLLGARSVALNRAAAADETGALGHVLAAQGRGRIYPRLSALCGRYLDAHQRAGDPDAMAALFVDLVIGDAQIRRAIGVLPEPDAAQHQAHVALALQRFSALARL